MLLMMGKRLQVTRKSKHINTTISVRPTSTAQQNHIGGQITDDVELSQRDEYELKSTQGHSTNSDTSFDIWTQREQKLLEQALAKYPKGASERWDKISEYIPGKSKVSPTSIHKLKR